MHTRLPTTKLSRREVHILAKLTTPVKIQDFLDSLPMNHEKKGETHMSPRRVLREKKAHCIEGALLAATALWLHGEPPLLFDLVSAPNDDDHVVALYKRNGYWGALSKTNHATIRFRDPVYKTIRELALSYFHEWFMNTNGVKTLRSYSAPLNLKRFGTEWITSEKDLWWLDKKLNALPHFKIAPQKNIQLLRKADSMELKAGRFVEWPK
ncbi:hypothetical protein A2841_03920 [Candidatus Kaiserbacteria bacterium RIFCSPHIGHO2_01_FULL_48_10]|uniref:Transglutaminase-like domain-containing protein n=1 Tax=Candidatus Kaiserbacteria bacterium RIFCSPHIGHO2_01_FULL_48_10 TaxID=1798476 RepID=A0A1F6C4S4_9BACT|nr:MAG: hypothetical protein A2841_03920 [Candidatus Kaiserbacteria bacterium RIFCSPHIGHO2_01_FULL_48_10]